MSLDSLKDKNLLKGIFLMAIALAFGLGALKYPVGKLERAGPGFFPMMVSGILFVLGAGMVLRSRFAERKPMEFSVKNLGIIIVSLVGFAVLSRYLNMIVGITFLVFVSTMAGTSYSWTRNAMVAAVLIGIAFIFQKGLGLQLPLY
jgi:hypothetical protein